VPERSNFFFIGSDEATSTSAEATCICADEDVVLDTVGDGEDAAGIRPREVGAAGVDSAERKDGRVVGPSSKAHENIEK
jgi:hypothetical protein